MPAETPVLDVRPMSPGELTEDPMGLLAAAVFGVDHFLPVLASEAEGGIDHVAVFSADAKSGNEVLTIAEDVSEETFTAWTAAEHFAGRTFVRVTLALPDGGEDTVLFVLRDFADWEEVASGAPNPISKVVVTRPDGTTETL